MKLARWLPTFLAFPLGGLIAFETVGSLDGPLTAALGGLITGAAIGAAQWIALRPNGIDARWVAHTAAGMAGGTAIAAVLTGAGTDTPDLVVMGLVAGAAVGGSQSLLLDAGRVVWIAASTLGWPIGWLIAVGIGVHVEEGFYVFGVPGALLATTLTWLALRGRLEAPLAVTPGTAS